MNLENLVAVGGLSGLYEMIANRSNGLIVEELKTKKRKFAPSRKHQFTPLESVAIYTDDGDSAPLRNVFQNMMDQEEDNPPIAPNSSSEDLREYFLDVLPNHDQDKVYPSDIRKVLKWFVYLKETGHLTMEAPEKAAEEAENESESE